MADNQFAFHYDNIPYKGHYKDEQMYVDYSKLFAKRRFMNMLVTAREMGKSYGAKLEIVLRSWYQDGRKSLWLRRFGTQVDIELRGDFWGTVPDAFYKKYGEKFGLDGPPVIEQDGSIYYIDGEPFMEMMALTEAVNAKGQERVGTANLILDEFIEKEMYKYIAPAMDEPTNYLLKMAKSFFRDANIPPDERHIYLLANAENIANPYFQEFNMVDAIKEDTEWLMHKNVLLWMPRMSEKLWNKLMEDPLNQIIMGTSYAAVALNNSFFNGGKINIHPKLNPNSKMLFSLNIAGVQYFIYEQTDKDGDKYFFVHDKGTFNRNRFVLDARNITHEDEKVIRRTVLQEFRTAISENYVKYSSIKARTMVLETVRSKYQ